MALRIYPRRISGQLTLLLCTIAVLLAGLTTVFLVVAVNRSDLPPPPVGPAMLMESAAIMADLNDYSAGERPHRLQQLLEREPRLDITLVGEDEAFDPEAFLGRGLPLHEMEDFGDGLLLLSVFPFARSDGAAGRPVFVFQFVDGKHGLMWPGRPPRLPFFGSALGGTLAFLALSLIVLGYWAARNLTAPLDALVKATLSFGRKDTAPVAFREDGPEEIRELGRAFNRMQTRLSELVERRTRALAAIGHDLRTPLTRLRMRAEMIDDPNLRDKACADIEHMDRQLVGLLTFLREGRSGEKAIRADFSSLLRALCDQAATAGRSPVPLRCDPKLTVIGRPTELQRAIHNLVDNALAYGRDVRIDARRLGGTVRTDVIDDGPGIAAADRQRMMEPFERGDGARQSDNRTGFGLGLAVSASIIESHGGTLELLETPGGGLTCRIELPPAQADS